MTALGIDVASRREYNILHNLGADDIDWDDLTYEAQLIAYHSGIDISDSVTEEKLRRWEVAEGYVLPRSPSEFPEEYDTMKKITTTLRNAVGLALE